MVKRECALSAFKQIDKLGVYVFTTKDIKKMFPVEDENTLKKSLSSLVKSGVLIKATKGVYVFSDARSRNSFVIEQVALALRRGFYSYVGLESALSEYGVISQIPISRITIMTTGKKGEYKTPFGEIEFTHTKRSISEVLDGSVVIEGRPLPVAKPDTAKRDLRRVGRNVQMMINEE